MGRNNLVVAQGGKFRTIGANGIRVSRRDLPNPFQVIGRVITHIQALGWRMRTLASLAIVTLLHAALADGESASAQVVTASPGTVAALGTVAGVAFDSLLMRPLVGANVWIPGTSHSALTDARGRFALDSVAAGRQQIAFSSAGLDSVGLGNLMVNADVVAGKTTDVTLTSPSRARLWSMVCATRGRIGSDSGIAFGTVLDGVTNARLAQAPVTFTWYNVNKGLHDLPVGEVSGNVLTDSTGVYFACGLPVGVQLTTETYGNKSQSGEVQYQIGERRAIRLELVASSEMVPGNTSRGTAVVRGIVLNERRAPVADALVVLSGRDTSVRSGADGSFAIRSVPSGTLAMQVRKVGFANTSRIVNVRKGEEVETSIVMTGATTLTTVNVGAERPKSPEMQALELRQKMGFGMAFDFTKDEPVTSLAPLMTVPRVKVTYAGAGAAPTISMTIDGGQRKCIADVYLDGRRTDVETIANYPPNLLAAMEVYNSPYQVPAQFMRTPIGQEKTKGAGWSGPVRSRDLGNSATGRSVASLPKDSLSAACGVVLYWTKAVLRP